MSYLYVKPVFDRRKQADTTGEGKIEIYCNISGQVKILSTGLKTPQGCWDNKMRRVNKKDSNYARKNYKIRSLVEAIEGLHLKKTELGGSFTVDDLGGLFKEGQSGGLIDFLKHEILSDKRVTDATTQYRWYMVNHLKAACGENIKLVDVDYNLIQKFDNYLLKSMKVSTAGKYHNQLKKFLAIAVKKKIIQETPYDHFKVARPKHALKDCLWYDDLDKLWGLSYQNKGYESVRLRFLFSCYTGLRISDNLSLRWEDITRGRIIKDMQKTGRPVVVPVDILSDRAFEILKTVEGKKTGLVFPKMSSHVINRELKIIGVDAGIPHSLNFHQSRHTFCTLLAHKSGSMFDVMRYAGIYKPDTAMVYVNMAKMFA